MKTVDAHAVVAEELGRLGEVASSALSLVEWIGAQVELYRTGEMDAETLAKTLEEVFTPAGLSSAKFERLLADRGYKPPT